MGELTSSNLNDNPSLNGPIVIRGTYPTNVNGVTRVVVSLTKGTNTNLTVTVGPAGAATTSLVRSGTAGNQVLGNFIGTDVTGAQPVGNLGDGVRVNNAGAFNVIATNLLSANNGAGG